MYHLMAYTSMFSHILYEQKQSPDLLFVFLVDILFITP